MTAEIKRIGRWTTQSALEAAMEELKDDDAVVIVAIGAEDKMMKFWCANANNMQVNWMADNIKHDLFQNL
jgi:hypothetical protein